jgi:hypothetical protein
MGPDFDTPWWVGKVEMNPVPEGDMETAIATATTASRLHNSYPNSTAAAAVAVASSLNMYALHRNNRLPSLTLEKASMRSGRKRLVSIRVAMVETDV